MKYRLTLWSLMNFFQENWIRNLTRKKFFLRLRLFEKIKLNTTLYNGLPYILKINGPVEQVDNLSRAC